MRALVADLSVARYAWTTVAARLRRDAGWRAGGVLTFREDAPEPLLPSADGWVVIRPTLAGVCGSDMKLLHGRLSLQLSAFYPAARTIPGHEVVGVVERVGTGVRRLSEGDRVVVEPVLGCPQKGLDPPCRACAAGTIHLCERVDLAGTACAGPGQGFNELVGGGWGERLTAHESQCVPVGALDDRRAVLAEPGAVALHAALRWHGAGERAVVIGPGSIGLLLTASLRRLHPDLDVTMVGVDAFGAAQAQRAGADRTVLQPAEDVLDAMAEVTGSRRIMPTVGRLPILDHGVDVVYDCVGTSATLDLALRLLRGRGTLVLVGTAARQPVDFSLVWFREITLVGAFDYGHEAAIDGRRTVAQMVEWLADASFPADGFVTHRFLLSEYAEALTTADAGPRAGAIKVAFRPNPDLETAH